MLLSCWGQPNGRDPIDRENHITSQAVWMDQPERERESQELEKQRKSKLGYQMGSELKQRYSQE